MAVLPKDKSEADTAIYFLKKPRRERDEKSSAFLFVSNYDVLYSCYPRSISPGPANSRYI
jgi:hypothetical protein